MLTTTSWVEKVKELVGLKAVSPFWGDKPAWYFWMSQISGAYLLELAETMDDHWESDQLAGGMFKIKHYPDTNGELFNNFSFEEQAFVQSDFFDHTHTPMFEKKEIGFFEKTKKNRGNKQVLKDAYNKSFQIYCYYPMNHSRVCLLD